MSPVLKDPKDAPKAEGEEGKSGTTRASWPACEVNDADMVRGALSIARDPSPPKSESRAVAVQGSLRSLLGAVDPLRSGTLPGSSRVRNRSPRQGPESRGHWLSRHLCAVTARLEQAPTAKARGFWDVDSGRACLTDIT